MHFKLIANKSLHILYPGVYVMFLFIFNRIGICLPSHRIENDHEDEGGICLVRTNLITWILKVPELYLMGKIGIGSLFANIGDLNSEPKPEAVWLLVLVRFFEICNTSR